MKIFTHYTHQKIAEQIKKQIQEEQADVSNNLASSKPVINDILVDFYLWNYRVDNAKEIDSNSLPFHKIRCHFY